ncbi:uncharacterized protein BP01DRAFT_338683 [Aspergillus saccharolyticus JOP 1030-1]|uniref:Zn(2)-C6 fungal-type domain-containing protein n=1 Tax=Aspergillus saccharolyticus JOP 1030-1 TaxID=1450539 RepID=A0A318ZP43_9EURO|nr:hypothetical protein BP01DRAFT_338683 [Aspergillus saccharolyticus JOP 1030-1]PYH46223.1 hypothetical protein BP01DRAFT_338683 [Aspergillus saccharolyticus JOP 1030-1]
MDSPTSNSRVVVACESCRKRKRKCDGLRPACSLCTVKRVACHYNTEKRNKRRFDADYVRGLEDQIAMLREELDRSRAGDSAAVTEDVPLDQGLDPPQAKADTSTIPDNMTTAIEDVSALIWRMSLESNGEQAFVGPSGNFCFPVDSWDSKEARGEKPTAVSDITSVARGLGLSWLDRVDVMARSRYLLDHFVRYVNPIHQFLDGELLSRLHGDSLSSELRLIKTAAMAAGAVYSDDLPSRTVGEEAAAIVDAMALQLCRQSPSVSTVQALSIMSWRELGLEQHNMAWMYNSMCASMALHLGLPVHIAEDGKESNRGDVNAGRKSEMHHLRLRALWSSVFMDRIATSLLGRNCMLPWRRIDAQSFISTVGPTPSLDELAFDHQCRLWFIHDQYMDRIYSFEFTGLDSSEKSRLLLDARDQLHAFRRQLSPQVRMSRTSALVPSIIYLHISYHMSHILIHRPYLREASQNGKMYQLCVRAMSTAAASIVRLLREYRKIAPLDLIPPFVVHSVLTAAVTHLCNATATHQALRSASIAQFRVCFHALWEMQARWMKAKRAIRLLRELARRWQVMVALPLQHGFPVSDPPEVLEEEKLEFIWPSADYPEDNGEDTRVDHDEQTYPSIFPDIFHETGFDLLNLTVYQQNAFDETI